MVQLSSLIESFRLVKRDNYKASSLEMSYQMMKWTMCMMTALMGEARYLVAKQLQKNLMTKYPAILAQMKAVTRMKVTTITITEIVKTNNLERQ